MRQSIASSLLVLTFASTGASCARKVANNTPSQKRPSAVHQAMQRHVDNAIDAGDGDVQARMLRQRMAANPDSLSARVELAAHYEKQGYADLALEHYRLAAERFPNETSIVVSVVRLLNSLQLNREAIQTIERFLAAHPAPSSELQAWLGYLYDQNGERDVAEKAHRAAIAASPGSAKLHNNLGYNLLLQSKLEEAIAEFRRALAIDPKMEMARNNLGMALVKTGGQDTQASVDRWRQDGGDQLAAHNNAAAALIEQGRYAEARRELDAALRLNPHYTPALKNLELLAALDGKPAALPSGGASRTAAPADGGQSAVVKSLKRFWFAIAGIEQQPPGAATRRGGE